MRLREAVAETQAPQLVRGQDDEDELARRRRKRAKAKAKRKGSAKARESVRFVTELREAAVAKHGASYEATIIREGPGNPSDKNAYSREALQEAVRQGLFEGLQAYADHQTPTEEREQPERSVRKLVGHFREARLVQEGGRVAVRARFVPITGPGYEWVQSLIESSLGSPEGKPLIGISIDGYGHAPDTQEINGRTYNLVREITALGSADLVTRTATGGRFHRKLSESLRDARAAEAARLELNGREMRQRVRKAVRRLEEAAESGDADAVAKAVRRLQEVASCKLAKPAKRSRVKVREVQVPVEVEDRAKVEQLEARTRKAEKRRRLAESEAAVLKRGVQARTLLSEAGVSGELARVWFDELAQQPTRRKMGEVLERRQAERREALATIRESMGLDQIEGAGRRGAMSTDAPTGRGLLDRMGIDPDELEGR